MNILKFFLFFILMSFLLIVVVFVSPLIFIFDKQNAKPTIVQIYHQWLLIFRLFYKSIYYKIIDYNEKRKEDEKVRVTLKLNTKAKTYYKTSSSSFEFSIYDFDFNDFIFFTYSVIIAAYIGLIITAFISLIISIFVYKTIIHNPEVKVTEKINSEVKIDYVKENEDVNIEKYCPCDLFINGNDKYANSKNILILDSENGDIFISKEKDISIFDISNAKSFYLQGEFSFYQKQNGLYSLDKNDNYFEIKEEQPFIFSNDISTMYFIKSNKLQRLIL